MYYINVSLWQQSLVDHFLSDSHLRPQRTIPEKGTGIKNCILNFQEQEWETGIPDSHSQLLGMGMTIPNFQETGIPPQKIFFLTLLPYYQQINTGPEVILCLKFKQDSLSLFILNEMRISTKVFNLIVTFVFTMQVKNQKKIDYFR